MTNAEWNSNIFKFKIVKNHFGKFLLLAEGADPNAKCEENNNQTALHAATTNGNLAIVHLLIQVSYLLCDLMVIHRVSLNTGSVNIHLKIVPFFRGGGGEINVKNNLYEENRIEW